jgi:hypothetical protein
LHDPAATNSGFELPIPLPALAAGIHDYRFTLVGTDGSSTLLPIDVQLRVAPAP